MKPGPVQRDAGYLKKFFWPQGIAVVGASADLAKPGGKLVQLLQEYGYPGRILPINPGRREIQGLPAFTSLAEINTAVDLVVIAVEATATLEIVRQCAALELKNIVVISAGFAETGAPGEALQNELAALIEEHALNVLGPNCIGFINSLQPAAASFSLTVDSGSLRTGPAAFVAQSGGLGILAIFLADLERMGCSYMISTGNEVDLDFAEVINFLAHEPRVKVIGGYLEGVKDGSGFRRSCRAAAEAGKPLLILKAGASSEAAAAIRSHTGALAGSEGAYRAFFHQEGVFAVETLTEMLSLFKAFAPGRLPRGNRAAVMSLSGGMGVLATDLCARAGLRLAEFSPETVQGLQQLMPAIATIRNPLDPTAAMTGRLPGVRRTIELIMADPGVDLFIFTTALWRSYGAEAGRMFAEIFQGTKKPLLVIWPGCSSETKEIIYESGVPFFGELKEGVNAAAALWRYADFLEKRSRRKNGGQIIDPAKRSAAVHRLKGVEGGLTEVEAKQILGEWGIAVPRGEVVSSLEQAVEAAGKIGYPVVLKALSTEIAHKTEAGAIRLGLGDAPELQQGWERMQRDLKERAPGAPIRGYLIEEMLPIHLEFIAGVKDDPVFGPLMLLGLGGIYVEIFQDLSLRLAPLEPEEVRQMLAELKSAPLFGGYRGAAPVEISSLVETVSRFSRLAVALRGSYREMEINPLVLCPDGRAVAVDALILR